MDIEHERTSMCRALGASWGKAYVEPHIGGEGVGGSSAPVVADGAGGEDQDDRQVGHLQSAYAIP